MNSPSPTGSRSWFVPDSRFALRAFLIGVAPMVGLLALMSGSLDSAVSMILLSVLCTAGIGGLFWVGVAILVGTVLQLLLPPLRPAPREVVFRATAREPDEAMLLRHYAGEKLGQGMSEAAVRRDLLRSGWNEGQADAALKQASLQQPGEATAYGSGAGDGR